MKRLAISLILVAGLLVPTTAPVNASEKCLANFDDSEWTNGTPIAVKNLLGFDLVETIKKPITPQPIHRYYLYGEHISTITYNYVGKNCLSREIRISTTINSETINYQYETLSDFLSKQSTNFLINENSVKYYAEIKNYISTKNFDVQKMQLLPNEPGSPRALQEVFQNKAEIYAGGLINPSYAFIYFPNKCGYWITHNGEKLYAISAGSYFAQSGIIKFNSAGICIGELRLSNYTDGYLPAGVNEKIADIKYVVSRTKSPTTITCKKGKITKKVSGTNPKCENGYKKI